MNLSLHSPLLFSVILLFNIASSTICHAVEIVRANFEFQGVEHPVDISLFDAVATGTVNNFLSYVDDGSYNNLLTNRSLPGFVIQAGAYTFDPYLNDGSFSYAGSLQFNGGLQQVASKGGITNEFKLSNLRGTIAMARVSGQINSAANEWFINLADNDFLDTVDEGFTVFGEVMGNGMDSIDLVSTIPVYDISSEIDVNGTFVSIPLVDYTISSIVSDITNSNLVVINSFDRLFKITDTIDLGDAVIDTTIQKDIIIQNRNTAALQIGSIDTSSVTDAFLITNPCQNITLPLNGQCIVQVEFSPTSSGFFGAMFDVEVLTYGYTFPVTIKTPSPEITASSEIINFGVQPVYDPEESFNEQRQAIIYINNNGTRDLSISSVTFNTTTPSEFGFIDNCTVNNAYDGGPVPAGGSCIFVVNFKPADLLEKSAMISVISDDPINKQLDIHISGGTSTDNDGIDNSIEDAAPNNGDGNNDEIPDRLQNNVVSFSAANGIYTTLITKENGLFTNVKPVQLSTIEKLPDGTTLDNEAFAFELAGFPVGSIAEFGIILPAGSTPTNIYFFGPSSDNSIAHWYALEKNASPGTFIFGDVSLTSASGNSIGRNVTSIWITDGGDGDADQLVNGKILFVGGPEITNGKSTSTGTTYWLLFLIPLSVLFYRNNKTVT